LPDAASGDFVWFDMVLPADCLLTAKGAKDAKKFLPLNACAGVLEIGRHAFLDNPASLLA